MNIAESTHLTCGICHDLFVDLDADVRYPSAFFGLSWPWLIERRTV